MTARIQKDFHFVSGIHLENEFYMNVYEIDLHFNVTSDNIIQQNVALDRIKYMFGAVIENSIFVYEKDTITIEKFDNADLKLCLLPEEPYDQIIGIVLFTKINAITEGRLELTDIRISSKLCDGVSYLHSVEENVGPFNLKGWWNDNGPIFSNKLKNKSKKIVKLTKLYNTWDDLNLGWEQKKPESFSNEIVFANFDTKSDK